MTQRCDLKKKWIRGALLLAAIAACDPGAPTEGPKDAPGGNQDVIEALAALPEAEVLQYSPDGAIPQFIRGELGKVDMSRRTGLIADDSALRAALPPILEAFRLENKDLVLRKVNTDELGGMHYRYAQRFNGRDVVGGDLVVHLDGNGAITAVNGTARGDVPATLGAVAIAASAADAAIEGDARWASLAGRSIRPLRTVYIQTPAGTLHKAYEQLVVGTRGQDPVEDIVYIDVDNGDVLMVNPQVQHARNRNTYSANGGTSLPGTLRRTEAQAATGDLDIDGAHDGAGHTYDLYKFFWNRDGIDNAGMTMISTAHYSTNYCNAFWNNTQMAYGDGNASQSCGPLARSIDVAGHELTHGVTSRESNLTYSGESGGLNESLSDVFGAGVEAFVLGGKNGTLSTDPKVFLIGDTVLPPFLRSLCDPAADGVSKDIWSSSLGSVDVHYSSGPNNLVFCLLSRGGTHPRGKTTIPVPAIGMEKALRLMYKANVDFLTASSNYAAMRNAMVTAAQQLGYDPPTLDAVQCAYAAIAVGTAPVSCGGTPPPADGVLSCGVPVTGLSDSTTGTMKFWSLEVPPGQTTLTITISGGTGDADLYVNFGSHPSATVYQCRPYLAGNSETCTITAPLAGTYYVGIRTYAPYSSVTLTATCSGCTGGTEPGNTPWQQVPDRPDELSLDLDENLSSSCGSGMGDTVLFTSLGGSTLHWRTTGATSIVDNSSVRLVYLNGTITPALANQYGWHINWQSLPSNLRLPGVCTGRSPAWGWQNNGNNGVYLQVDTSACGYMATPRYFTSLGGSAASDHWRTMGATSIVSPTATGFRVDVFDNDGLITPADASARGWHINWQARPEGAQAGPCTGAAGQEPQAWQQYGTRGLYLDVDTSACGLESTPRYLTSFGGNSHHARTTGATSIYSPTATGFRVYVFDNQGEVTPADAYNRGWHINWQALPR